MKTTVQGIRNWENANDYAKRYGLKIKMTPPNIEPGNCNQFRLLVDTDVYPNQNSIILTQTKTIEEIQTFIYGLSLGREYDFIRLFPKDTCISIIVQNGD